MNLFDVDLAPDGPTMKESNTTVRGRELVRPIPSTPVGNLGVCMFVVLRIYRAISAHVKLIP